MAQIIPKKPLPVERLWQKELGEAFTDPAELLKFLDLNPDAFQADIAARRLFPMRVPRPFAMRMQKACVTDPLLQQVLPLRSEFVAENDFVVDPLAEHDTKTTGLLHKYQSRVLLVIKGGCAVNCRYCFRRHFPYQENSINKQGWQSNLEYIASDEAIDEVIYSGGDPLMATDDFLQWLTSEVATISHVKRLRIHTRLPVVIPARITQQLVSWLTSSRLQPVMVLHINHANEIDDALVNALSKLKQAGVVLLNQSVLLKNINDNADAQVLLNQRLFEAGVMPYYLHMLDKVEGASHFDVPDSKARMVLGEMIKRLPGYMVPKLVREIGGQPGKTPVDLILHP